MAKTSQNNGRAKRPAPPHAFKPGESGNPGGRPKLPFDIVQKCREFTSTAIDELIDIATRRDFNDPAMMGVKVRALETLINRGWGTAPQTVNLAGEGTTAIVVRVVGAAS